MSPKFPVARRMHVIIPKTWKHGTTTFNPSGRMKTNPIRIRPSTPHQARGFTLVELLLVLAIMRPAGRANRLSENINRGLDAKETPPYVQIKALDSALETFEVDNGYFPKGQNGLIDLVQRPASAQNWHGPYLAEIRRIPGSTIISIRFQANIIPKPTIWSPWGRTDSWERPMTSRICNRRNDPDRRCGNNHARGHGPRHGPRTSLQSETFPLKQNGSCRLLETDAYEGSMAVGGFGARPLWWLRHQLPVRLNDGNSYVVRGRPRLNTADNRYYMKDAAGNEFAIPAGRVVEIAPVSMASRDTLELPGYAGEVTN